MLRIHGKKILYAELLRMKTYKATIEIGIKGSQKEKS